MPDFLKSYKYLDHFKVSCHNDTLTLLNTLACNSHEQGHCPTYPQYNHQSQEITSDTSLLSNQSSDFVQVSSVVPTVPFVVRGANHVFHVRFISLLSLSHQISSLAFP